MRIDTDEQSPPLVIENLDGFTDLGDLEEVQIPDVLENPMELKKPNEIYNDIYSIAKKKAKKAKKEALEALLEAKNIKKTYLLDDSSDDSDLELDFKKEGKKKDLGLELE